MNIYQFEILTPRGRIFSEKIVHALIPAEDGFVGVLANHTDYVTSSPGGPLELRLASGQTQKFRTGPGFFQVRKNEAFLLAQSAETDSL